MVETLQCWFMDINKRIMESKFNHDLVGIDQNGDFCSSFFAFEAIKDMVIRQGKTISEIKPAINNKPVVNEKGFRNFLLTIVSLPFDLEKITPQENKVINKITAYLTEPIEEEIQ